MLAYCASIKATEVLFRILVPQLAYYAGAMCWNKGNSKTICEFRASTGVLCRHIVLASSQLKDYLGFSGLSWCIMLAYYACMIGARQEGGEGEGVAIEI